MCFFFCLKIILKTSSSPTSNQTATSLPQGQILQTADGQLIILQSAEQPQTQQPQYVQVGGQSKIEEDFISLNNWFYWIVLQLSNVQTSQQPQTITIPAGALQLAGNGQQIVQLATPTKSQAASQQNGTVIMVKIFKMIYFLSQRKSFEYEI